MAHLQLSGGYGGYNKWAIASLFPCSTPSFYTDCRNSRRHQNWKLDTSSSWNNGRVTLLREKCRTSSLATKRRHFWVLRYCRLLLRGRTEGWFQFRTFQNKRWFFSVGLEVHLKFPLWSFFPSQQPPVSDGFLFV